SSCAASSRTSTSNPRACCAPLPAGTSPPTSSATPRDASSRRSGRSICLRVGRLPRTRCPIDSSTHRCRTIPKRCSPANACRSSSPNTTVNAAGSYLAGTGRLDDDINTSVFHRLVVVVAERFDELGVGHQRQRRLNGPRLQEGLAIVDGNRQLHVTEIGSAKTFGHAQRIAVWTALQRVEPAAISETCGLDDEDVAVPTSD